jgi:hypothetical protein
MFKSIGVAITVAVLLTAAVATSASEPARLKLVESGRAHALIVMPAGRTWQKDAWAIQTERHAAMTLQSHVAMMTGVKLPIVDESALGSAKVDAGRIVPEAGKTQADVYVLVGEGALARELGVTSDALRPGGIRIQSTANALVLIGHPKLSHPRDDGGGVRHAVIYLLESLGCRYLWPGPSGRVVPSMTTLEIAPLAVTYSPPIQQRRIRPFSLGPKSEPYLAHLGISMEEADQAMKAATATKIESLADAMRDVPAEVGFTQWHGLGGDIGLAGGHAFGEAWDRWGKDHPEWFALQPDGTRDQTAAKARSQFCTTNLDLIQAIADDVLAKAAKLPPEPCISVDFNDGGYTNFCQCDNCRKLDPPDAPLVSHLIFAKVGESQRKEEQRPSLSDRYVWFWNQIAQRVTAVRPDVRLGISAYSIYSTAPVREKLHPSLVLRYVPHDIGEWDGWRKAGATAIYWRPNIFHSKARQGVLRIQAQYMAQTFAYLFERALAATDMDSLMGHWSTAGINYYAAAKLNWNPHLTYEQILEDYCNPAFGSACEPMKQYFRRAEQISGAWDVYTPPTDAQLAELRDLLRQAQRMAGDDEAILARIRFLRLGLNYTQVYETLERMVADLKAGKTIDREESRQLIVLNYLMLRDIGRHQPLALNVGWIMRGTGYNAYWETIGGRNYRAPEERIAAVDQRGIRMTGDEDSLADLLTLFGLTQAPPADRPAAPAKPAPAKQEVEADEAGRAL